LQALLPAQSSWDRAMNVADAIKAHAQWKVKLTGYLMNPDHSIRAEEVALDNRCELGKWIHGEGAKLGAEIADLKTTHAAFHRAAAAVVRKIDSGQERDQNKLTGFSSEFGALSLKIVNQLKAIAAKIS
jgi:hypothetical protein